MTLQATLAAILLLAALTLAATEAAAVSRAVKFACMSDYFAYCSSYEVGSPALRQCMRNAGAKLSNRCVNALVAAGEVSKADAARRKARAAQAD
jgi:hypothetical protein